MAITATRTKNLGISRKNGDRRTMQRQSSSPSSSSSSSSSSSQKGLFFFHKHTQRFLIILCRHRGRFCLLHCLLLFFCYGSFLLGPKQIFVSALRVPPQPRSSLMPSSSSCFVSTIPTTSRQTIIRQRHSVVTTSMSELASSVSAENDNENENDDDPVGWRSNLPRAGYASPLLWGSRTEWKTFMKQFNDNDDDHLWEQVKLEALSQLSTEPEAGPQLYQSILSQGSLVEAIVSIIARTFTIICLLQVCTHLLTQERKWTMPLCFFGMMHLLLI